MSRINEDLVDFESPNFNIFKLEEKVGRDNILPVTSIYVFSSLGLFSIIDYTKFEPFIFRVASGYHRQNPYHTDLHAADMVQSLLEKVLVSIGIDKFASHALKVSNTKTTKDFSLAKVISYMIKYVIVILFLVEGVNILKLQVLTNIGMDIIAYMPYAISSAIILD